MAINFKNLTRRSMTPKYKSVNSDNDVTWTNVGHGHMASCGAMKKQAHKGWIDFDFEGRKFRLFASTYTTQTGLNITIARMNKK